MERQLLLQRINLRDVQMTSLNSDGGKKGRAGPLDETQVDSGFARAQCGLGSGACA
jgi:hypothetical protein